MTRKAINMENDTAKTLFDKLMVSRYDFLEASNYASAISINNWHYEIYEIDPHIYTQQSAFTTALVVSYCRPFTKSKGWPLFPKELIPFNEDEFRLHSELLNRRHTIYAHSDSINYRMKTHNGWLIEKKPSFRLSKEEISLLNEMLVNLDTLVLAKISQLEELVGVVWNKRSAFKRR